MRFGRAAALACLAVALSACQTATDEADAPRTQAALASPPAEEALAPTAGDKASPDLLVGKTDREINGLFGKPSLRRRESGAEFWQYSSPGCIIDLYFYNDAGTKRVSYVSFRDPATGRVGGGACQDRLVRSGGN